MNQKDIDFFFQSALQKEIIELNLNENLTSTNEMAKTLNSFMNIKNIYILRNFISNFRKFMDKTQNIDPKDQYLYLIMKGLILEILYGPKPEIKGSLTSLIGLITGKQENLKIEVYYLEISFFYRLYSFQISI